HCDQHRLMNEIEGQAVPAYEGQRLFKKVWFDPVSQKLQPAEALENPCGSYSDKDCAEPWKQRYVIVGAQRYGRKPHPTQRWMIENISPRKKRSADDEYRNDQGCNGGQAQKQKAEDTCQSDLVQDAKENETVRRYIPCEG